MHRRATMASTETSYNSFWTFQNRPPQERACSAMTLSVPENIESQKLHIMGRRKTSLGSTPALMNGRIVNGGSRVTPQRRSSIADAFSESIRTLASTARRNSSPLSRKSTKKTKKTRLISKNGICNVYNKNVPKKDRQYLRDIFTTLIDVKWRLMLSIFGLVFAGSWTTFASAYYTIALLHGDILDKDDITHINKTHCVVNLDSFYSSFLFAVETHHTIGYGHRYVTTECPMAGLTVCLQAVCGLLIQSFMVGIVFAKLARPKKRAETIIFSESAVISLRDGLLCFQCRVGDMRNTHLVEAHVRLQFISERETLEGEIEPLHQFEMKVGTSVVDDDRLFLIWPVTIVHVIDEHSPLFNYTSQGLSSAQFEIVVILEGIVESTGMTVQAKSSYLPCEISWGHRFRKLVTYQRGFSTYAVDYNVFNSTYAVKTPSWSAREHYTKNNDPKEYYSHDSQETKSEDNNRSWESTPTPSPFTFSNPSSPLPSLQTGTNSVPNFPANNKNPEEMALLCPPSIVVQCPSTCSSPSHPMRRFPDKEALRLESNCDISTRPSTALSDLEEECSEHESPTQQPSSFEVAF